MSETGQGKTGRRWRGWGALAAAGLAVGCTSGTWESDTQTELGASGQSITVDPFWALSPLVFDAQEYLQLNPDVAQNRTISAQDHWLQFGIKEGRCSRWTFCAMEYRESYSDLEVLAPDWPWFVNHYVQNGAREGRVGRWALRPEVFNPAVYLSLNRDLFRTGNASDAKLRTHWVRLGIAEQRRASEGFFTSDYLELNPDLQGKTPAGLVEHYVRRVLTSPNEQRQAAKAAPNYGPVRFLSAEETVYDWSQNTCDPYFIPDLPARAFITNNTVHLLISHTQARQLTGSTLDTVRLKNCDITFKSDGLCSPLSYNNEEWLAAPYALDDSRVVSLIHNEYHGEGTATCNPSSSCGLGLCWHNSITHAQSNNGGFNFSMTSNPLIATEPIPSPMLTQSGIFGPTNILRSGSWYYAGITPTANGGLRRSCMMRTQNVEDPASWRATRWDANLNTFVYDRNLSQGTTSCDSLPTAAGWDDGGLYLSTAHGNRAIRVASVAYNAPPGSPNDLQFVLQVAENTDLTRWSSPITLVQGRHGNSRDENGQINDESIAYPALIDPTQASTGRNFEWVGSTPYLYYTRFRKYESPSGAQDLNRDLVRIKLQFLQ